MLEPNEVVVRVPDAVLEEVSGPLASPQFGSYTTCPQLAWNTKRGIIWNDSVSVSAAPESRSPVGVGSTPATRPSNHDGITPIDASPGNAPMRWSTCRRASSK